MLIVLAIILTMSAASAQDVDAADGGIIAEASQDIALESDAAQDVLGAKATDDDNASSDESDKLAYASDSNEGILGAKMTPTISVQPLTAYYGDKNAFTATLTADGVALAGHTLDFTINGRTYSKTTNSNGVASLDIGLKRGSYPITVSYAGDANTDKASASSKVIVVSSKVSKLSVTPLHAYYGDKNTFTATLTVDGFALEGRTVDFTVNGRTYSKTTNSKGVASLGIGLYKGKYPITVSYAGETNVNKAKVSSEIIIFTNNAAKISAPAYVAYKSASNNVFTATLTVDGIPLDGRTVDFTVNGRTYSKVTDSNGVAGLPIGLNKGSYPVSVSYAGESNINKASASSKVIVVSSKTSKLSVQPLHAYYGDKNTFTATLTVDGIPLDGRTVSFTVNGKTYSKTTNSKGVASLGISLYKGSYPISVSYAGETNVNNAKVSSEIIIFTNNAAKISAPAFVAYKSAGDVFTATLTVDGIPLDGRTVDFTVNGRTYSKVTDSNGVAGLPIGLNKGSYPVSVSYAGESNINKASASSKVIVVSSKTSKLSVQPLHAYYGDKNTFTATLTVDGIPLDGRTVAFTVNGKTYSKTTNSKGVASLDIGLYKGKYPISVSYAGETNVNKAKASSEIIIFTNNAAKISAPIFVAYKSAGDVFNATLTVDGIPLDGRTVDFTVNGRTYSKVTDSNGVAGLPIGLNKGSYPVSVSYAGESNINKASASSKVIVVSSNASKLSVKPLTAYYGDKNVFTATLTVDGFALGGRTVDFTVNGRTYSKTTNANGVASLDINLKAGNYSISASYGGETYVNKAKASSKITILQRISEVMTRVSSGAYKHNTLGQFKVKLADENGSPLKNFDVTFTVNSVDYARKTDSSGIATLDIKLRHGTYSVKVSSPNKDNYLGVTKTYTIEVQSSNTRNNGFWLFGRDMNSVNLNTLKNYGTKHIFLNYKAIELYGQSGVESFVQKANGYGIQVHIWMQVFYDGDWHSPADGKFDYDLINSRINLAKSYAKIKGISGIHMDYLRYPGTAYKHANGTEAINYFTQRVCEEIHAINPKLIVSAAIMPEPSKDIYYYGQDVATLTKYLDVIVPMVYKGNYNQGTSWIQKVTQTLVKQSSGAQVWVGLQSYKSDSNPTKLSASELLGDADAASAGGATGVIMFRWGLVNYIDFNKV